MARLRRLRGRVLVAAYPSKMSRTGAGVSRKYFRSRRAASRRCIRRVSRCSGSRHGGTARFKSAREAGSPRRGLRGSDKLDLYMPAFPSSSSSEAAGRYGRFGMRWAVGRHAAIGCVQQVDGPRSARHGLRLPASPLSRPLPCSLSPRGSTGAAGGLEGRLEHSGAACVRLCARLCVCVRVRVCRTPRYKTCRKLDGYYHPRKKYSF